MVESRITVDRWTGTGFLQEDAETGAAGYIISGGLGGGSETGEPLEELQDLLGCKPWLEGSPLGALLRQLLSLLGGGGGGGGNDGPSTRQSEAINLSTGNLWRTESRTDARDEITTITWDAMKGSLESQTDPAGNNTTMNGAGPEGRGRGVQDWIRGRALAGLGRDLEATAVLECAWPELHGVGAGLEAARVVVDLVDLYREQARVEEARDLLGRAGVLYQVEGLDRRVVAVLYGLQGAAARGELRSEGIWAAREALREPRPPSSEAPVVVH